MLHQIILRTEMLALTRAIHSEIEHVLNKKYVYSKVLTYFSIIRTTFDSSAYL